MVTPLRKCPACNAQLEVGSIECPYCGSQVVQVALSYKEREEVNRVVKRLNAQIFTEQTHYQRLIDIFLVTVFGVGTALIIIMWLVVGWSPSWIALLFLPLVLIIIRKFLSRYYLQRKDILLYLGDIEPQIRRFLLEHKIPRWQFDQMADFILPGDAPLRRFLAARTKLRK